MMKKLVHIGMALSLMAGAVATTTTPAAAWRGRGYGVGVGIAAGVIGLGILAATARPRYYYGGCYLGPRSCDWVGRHCFINSWGDRVCHGGHWGCYRPTICD